MFTKRFWIDAIERAIKTFAQFMLASGALDVASTDLATSIQTKAVGAGMAAVISILTSLVSSGFGQKDSASVVDTPGDDGFVSGDVVLFFGALLLGMLLAKVFLC